jgi:hypothetical protein
VGTRAGLDVERKDVWKTEVQLHPPGKGPPYLLNSRLSGPVLVWPFGRTDKSVNTVGNHLRRSADCSPTELPVLIKCVRYFNPLTLNDL